LFEFHEVELGFPGRLLAGPLRLSLDPTGGLLLRGASGSGKSSLLRVLAALARPRAGRVSWRGEEIAGRLATHRRRVHLVEQRPLLQGANLREALVQGLRLRGLPAPADEALTGGLRALGLDLELDSDPARLSGGESLRVALLRGSLLPVECLLLDEPTAGLDEEAAQKVRRFISGFPPFVVVSHEAAWESHCARRLELREGGLHAA